MGYSCDEITIRHKKPKSFFDWLDWARELRGYYGVPLEEKNQRLAYDRYLRKGWGLTEDELDYYEPDNNDEGGMKLKNVAALLNEDATTISCRFGGSDKEYVYRVTQAMAQRLRDFKAEHKGAIKVVSDDLKDPVLVEVHDEPQLDLETNTTYRWVVGILNDWEIHEARKKEALILQGLQARQRGNAKDQVLRSFGLESVAQLLEKKES